MVIVAAAALASLVAPTHQAQAAEEVTITAIGQVSLWSNWECIPPNDLSNPKCAASGQVGENIPTATPRFMKAPVAPSCTVLCPSAEETKWLFSAWSNPNDPAPCLVGHSNTAAGACTVWARGTIFNANPPGAEWCGPFSQGGQLNRLRYWIGPQFDELSGAELANAGPYTMTYPVSRFQNSAGAGRAVITLLDAPECGLNPTTSFAGEHSFQASLTMTWARP